CSACPQAPLPRRRRLPHGRPHFRASLARACARTRVWPIRLGVQGGFQASATGADAVHMQVLLVVLAIAGSTAWLAVDASKRDWTDNGFAKNVPTWVIGSLLLWPIVLLLYVFSHRK